MTASVIESDLTIDGNIVSKEGTVSVKGRVKGDIQAKTVDVAGEGTVDGAVTADTVKIDGKQTGSVSCTELSLGATSHVSSKVTAKTMTSVKGARLTGEVQITG